MTPTIRVQTQWRGNAIRLTQDDGKSVDHAALFEYNGKEYNLLGGFYYDLEPDLIKHIFKD